VFFYRLLSGLALLAYSPWALLQAVSGRRRPGDLRGRLGRTRYPDLSGGIWIHAVSVGEVGVALNLLAALSRRRPGARLGLSVTTAAGATVARSRAPAEVSVFPFPFDLQGPVEKALSRVRPGLVLLTETELWPLFLQRAAARGVPVALVNGRISERSFRRYRLVRGFLSRVLSKVSLFAMQSSEDADRVAVLGAPRERIVTTGNLKYDLAAPGLFPDAARLALAADGRPIVVAASTAEGEERVILEAWREVGPSALLAIAPRRPERFGEVARLLSERGLSQVSRSGSGGGRADVYLLDSMGELPSLFRHASVAFIGGSLVPVGGHNPIEAWAAGAPVMVGPHTENFREISEQGERLGILRRVAGATRLAGELRAALSDLQATRDLGQRAERFVAQNRGAADRTAEAVVRLLEPAAGRRAAR
jgi:3-deoxy-D-manno-octulosonic-acid transferase